MVYAVFKCLKSMGFIAYFSG